MNQRLKDILTVLVPAAVGAGGLGLVALLGLSIEWLRFSLAGLPADEAVAALPEQQLFIVGAVALGGTLLVSALPLLALFALDRCGRLTLASAAFLALLVAGGLAVGHWAFTLDGTHEAIYASIVVALAASTAVVALLTPDRFLWMGLALFVTIGLSIATLGLLLYEDDPQLKPAALLRQDDETGMSGFWVAHADERVYLARENEGSPAAVYAIPCKDVIALAIGKFQGKEEARRRASLLRDQLQRDRGSRVTRPDPPPDAKDRPPVCE